MTWVMVDIESDGPCPSLFSMVSFGAIVVDHALDKTFYSDILQPLSNAAFEAEALAVSGVTRQQQLDGREAGEVMRQFDVWLKQHCKDRAMFVSDNNGFDWQFINWYFHNYLARNPFGFSSTNLGSLYKGLVRNGFQNFKHLRKTRHTHHPVDDARGNAEAMLHMIDEMGLKTSL